MVWKACLVLVAFAALSHAQTTDDSLRVDARNSFPDGSDSSPYQVNYEWEGYDGWYNNPAHPEWGGAGEPRTS